MKRKMALRRILRHSLIANNQQVLFGTSQMLNTVLDMNVKVYKKFKYIFHK